MKAELILSLAAFAVSFAAAAARCTDGEFTRDPASCDHFFKCDHGNWVKFSCGPGTWFNPKINVCDWPYNVKCDVTSGGQSTGGQYQGGHSGQYSGQNSGGQYQGGQNSGGQYPGVQNSGGQSPGGQNSGGQYPGGQNSGGQYPGGQNSGGQYPGGQNSGGQYPGGQSPGPYNGGNGGQNTQPPNNNQGSPGQEQHQAPPNSSDEGYLWPIQNPDSGNGESFGQNGEERPRPTIDDLYNNKPYPYNGNIRV